MCPTLPQILSWKTGPTGQHLVQRYARMKSLVSCPDRFPNDVGTKTGDESGETEGVIPPHPTRELITKKTRRLTMCFLPWHTFR